ncbi:hypothetical protein ACFU3J_15505 [Streptomyces sp. NPDC057411]|uniref:hypothetical protein n=1 Tax=unclassified Streptomyces TaxID=2593676 RepID=UPI00363D7E89
MTITTGPPPPTRGTPVTLALRFLTGGVTGAALAALVVGVVIESVPLFVGGLALPAVHGLLVFLLGMPGRARQVVVAPRTALARIESLQAIGSESSDVPVRFDLTVAPDEGPAYRVEVTQDINLVDLSDYRPRGVVVVQYPPDRPWRARLVKRPTPEWERRAASAYLDPAPDTARVAAPLEDRAFGFVVLLGLLCGAAAVVLLFRADLFGRADPASSPSTAGPSAAATSSTTVVSSATATVALGPGRSFLDEGELDRAVASLTRDGAARQALTVVVRERLLTVVFSPTGTQTLGFDPGSLPYDRFPALVEEAAPARGAGAPRNWQVTADRLTGSLTIRVVVTGAEGSASLEANGHGTVVRRTPAR